MFFLMVCSACLPPWLQSLTFFQRETQDPRTPGPNPQLENLSLQMTFPIVIPGKESDTRLFQSKKLRVSILTV